MKSLPGLYLLVAVPVFFAQTPAASPPRDASATAPDAAATAPEAPPPPSEEQQAKIIAAIRANALAWESRLPNFVCTRTTRGEYAVLQIAQEASPKAASPKTAPKGSKTNGAAASADSERFRIGPPQMVRMVEERLIYADHRETYALQMVNGQAARGSESPPEALSVADFSRMLTGVFAESAHADFKWKGMVALRGLPAYAFDYSVAVENSNQELVSTASRITVAFHGTFYADRITQRIISIGFLSDRQPKFPLTDVQRLFDFGQTVLNGKFYLMPLKGQTQWIGSMNQLPGMKQIPKPPQVRGLYTTEFISYRRYTASAAQPD